jgi:pantetheine-phosphate adenylyltransferase
MIKVLYPGSFDPITYGHIDIIKRALKIFEKIIIGVTNNPQKQPFLTLEERIKLIKKIFKSNEHLEVTPISGLVVDFMKKNNIRILIRGIRTTSDFEYEFQMALANRTLYPEIETIFILTSEKNEFISSSIVKEICYFGGDLKKFAPKIVATFLQKKYHTKKK